VVVRQSNGQSLPLSALVDTLETGVLLLDEACRPALPAVFAQYWHQAQAETWTADLQPQTSGKR